MKHDFSEMEKLVQLLDYEKVPFETKYERNVTFERAQVFFPQQRDHLSDVIIIYDMLNNQPISFGAPLLEQMGLLPEEYDEGDVQGGLTAEEVCQRWKNYWEKNKEGF